MLLSRVGFCGFVFSIFMASSWAHAHSHAQAHSGRMYMGKFGASSPKPHLWMSNDATFLERIVDRGGTMTRAEMQACTGKTARRYIDGSGLVRHAGVKKALRESAHPA